jgi:hypothetical protein
MRMRWNRTRTSLDFEAIKVENFVDGLRGVDMGRSMELVRSMKVTGLVGSDGGGDSLIPKTLFRQANLAGTS